MFICKIIGHRLGTDWEWNRQIHATCKTCDFIISKQNNKKLKEKTNGT